MTPTLLFVFVLVVSSCQAKVTKDKTGCPTDFEKKCSCGVTSYLGEDKYVVNCTNSGFTNADMLELLPEETQVLLFTGNSIRELPPNIFGSDIDYDKLEVIDMTNNKIRHIRGQAFHRVSNVERLVLNHNDLYINGSHEHPRIFANMYNLKALHLTNAFTEYVDSKKYLVNLENIFFGSNLSKLEKLHLEQNEIWVIPNRDMFCQLPSLMDLYLGDNKLSVFDVDMDCLKHLRYVDLEGNKFNTFTKPVLRRFDALNERSETPFEINLSDNYFVCDCGITDFSEWLRTTQVKVRSKDSLKCREGQPSSNAGAFVTEVHEATCLAEEARTGSDATAIVVVLLVTIMATLVAVILYMNVTWVKNKTTDFVYMIKKRGAYTSLLTKPEEPEVNV